MFKKFLVVTLGLVMFVSCQQNSSTDSKNGKTAVKKEVKKNIEVKFSFEDFTNTTPTNLEPVTSRGMKITFKSLAENPQEVMISNMGINGGYSNFYASVSANDKLDDSYSIGSLVVMGSGATETLWLKTYKLNAQTGAISDGEIKFPALVKVPVRDLKTDGTIYLEIVIDKDGKILYEKATSNPDMIYSESKMVD